MATMRTFHCDSCNKNIPDSEKEYLVNNNAGSRSDKPLTAHLCESCKNRRSPFILKAVEIQ